MPKLKSTYQKAADFLVKVGVFDQYPDDEVAGKTVLLIAGLLAVTSTRVPNSLIFGILQEKPVAAL